MKWLACALFVLGMVAARPASAQSEDVIKGAFIMCGMQHVLIACDDLVKMPDMNNIVRSNAYGTRAATLVQMGRIDEAQRDLDTALKLNPDNQDVKRFKALLLGKTSAAGAGSGADSAALQQCESDADVSARLQACDAVIAAKHADTPAVQAATYDLRAAAFLDAGQYAKSLADLDTADHLAPTREGAAVHRIQAMMEAGDYPGALAATQSALKASPVGDTDLLLHDEAELLYLTRDRVEAVKTYESIYQAHTGAVMAKYWSAIIRLELRQDASSDLRDLLGNSMMSPLGAAIIHWRLRDGGKDAVLREAQLSRPDAPCIAYFNLGHDAWLRGDLREARADLQQAIATGRVRLPEYRAAKLLISRL